MHPFFKSHRLLLLFFTANRNISDPSIFMLVASAVSCRILFQYLSNEYLRKQDAIEYVKKTLLLSLMIRILLQKNTYSLPSGKEKS